MHRFSEGDHVRVDIPDETDPDHEPYHGVHGRVVPVLTDAADSVSGDTRDSRLYRVALDTGKKRIFAGVTCGRRSITRRSREVTSEQVLCQNPAWKKVLAWL
jgi:ribosomal protein L21E